MRDSAVLRFEGLFSTPRGLGVELEQAPRAVVRAEAEIGAKAILIAIMPDEAHPAAAAVDEERQRALRRLRHPPLREVRTRRDLRPPHLLQRGALEDQVVLRLPRGIAEQEGDVFRHVRHRRVEPAVRDGDAGIESNGAATLLPARM
jgi:hypothetical protein